MGSFFCVGHDKRAEAAVIRQEYGSVANFVEAHGYGPSGPKAFGAAKTRARRR